MKAFQHYKPYIKLIFCCAALVFSSSHVWTACDYCEVLDTPPGIQTCQAIGESTCGVYYASAKDACCSNNGSGSCDDLTINNQSITYYYKLTDDETCSGVYHCQGGTGTPCTGDYIVPSVNNCTTSGNLIPQTLSSYRSCE